MARLTKQFESSGAEHTTPNDLYEPLQKEFHFTLDVAATCGNSKCSKFITVKQNALQSAWHGTCWLNPPYGRGLDKWMRKCVDEQARGVTTVALIPARTNTTWFHEIALPHAEVRFVRGRPKFNNADVGLPWPLLILIFRGYKKSKKKRGRDETHEHPGAR
jgi:phage N-6-adenine-methyltransferase